MVKNYIVNYKPFVTIGKKKVYTDNVDISLMAKDKRQALKMATAILASEGHKYARLNKKYLKVM